MLLELVPRRPLWDLLEETRRLALRSPFEGWAPVLAFPTFAEPVIARDPEAGTFMLSLAAPGLDPETQLEVAVDGRRLSVAGGGTTPGARTRFAYQWDLGADLSEAEVSATYDAGVLTVKVEGLTNGVEKSRRRIPIETGWAAEAKNGAGTTEVDARESTEDGYEEE